MSSGQIFTVSNSAQLRLTLRAAKGGDTVLLAGGHYGVLAFSDVRPDGLVTVKPLDAAADVTFSQIRVMRSENLLFEGMTVHNPGVGGRRPGAAVQLNGVSKVTLSDMSIHGSLDDNPHNDGHGIQITASRDVMVLDTDLRQVHAGIVLARSSNVVVAGNSVSEAREGINMSEISNGLFEANHLFDFTPQRGDHADFFQVHSSRNGASHNLVFRDNVMIQPHDFSIGGIFIANEGEARHGRHTNILIENNFYEGTYRNAIAVRGANDLVIRQNTLIEGTHVNHATAIVVGYSDNVLVENNIAPLLHEIRAGRPTNITWSNNVDVQDWKFGGQVSADALFDRAYGDTTLESLAVKAGSLADQKGAGARITGEFGAFSAGTAELMGQYGALMSADLPVFAMLV